MTRDKIRRVDLRPDEWIAGTFGQLTIEQQAVYSAVVLSIYSKNGPVDDDVERFVQAFRWEPRRHRHELIRRTLDELVEMGKLHRTEDGKLTNDRSLEELEAAFHRVDVARANGVQGGRPLSQSRSNRVPIASQSRANRRTSPNGNNSLVKPGGLEHTNHQLHSSHRDTESEPARASELRQPARRAHDAGPEPRLTDHEAARKAASTSMMPARARPSSKADKQLEQLAAEARRKFMKRSS